WLTLGGVGVPKGRIRIGALLAVSAAALWTQPVQSNLGLGQINLLLMTAIIWDLRPRHAAESPKWTGVATGIAAGIKLTPLIFIPFLIVTRRFREAAVATAAFAATVGIGFAVVPGASAAYWPGGLFDRVTGTPRASDQFFFAAAWNQSLRGFLSRLLVDGQLAIGPWLIAAILAGVTGLLCATWLYRDGYPMLGLLTCALTGLLISPVSWLDHWVWVAPWLAALAGMVLVARGVSWRAWLGIAATITLAFGNWPAIPVLTASMHGMNVIADVPLTQPFSWHGYQLIAGNMYLIAGAAGLLALLGWGVVRAFMLSPAIAPTIASQHSPMPEPTNAEVMTPVTSARR